MAPRNSAPQTRGAPPRSEEAATRSNAWIAWLAGAVAVPVALLVAYSTGALDPVQLGDAGPLVRFGGTALRVVHDLSAALTIGLLLIGAFIAPESRTSQRRATAARAAVISGAVWAATAGTNAVTTFATAYGAPIGGVGFWDSFWQNLSRMDLIRLPLIEAGIVLVVLVGASWARTRGALAWTFLVALIALVPLSFTGHASGDQGHEQAVTAMLIHLVSVCLWVGGLLALILLRPVLGTALEACVRRYSTVALWSFLAVGGSGVLFAVLQANTLSDLTSPYWLVIWAKVIALIVLGFFGVAQRRLIIARGVERKGAFVRLATVEAVIMSITMGLAVALGRTQPPVASEVVLDRVLGLTGFPEPAPYEASVWLTAWQFDWLFGTTAVVAIGLYLAGVARLRRRGDTWPISWTIMWVIGWLLFIFATSGAPGVYGRVMFSMHMVQHMALMMLIPIFLVSGSAITLALRALTVRHDKTLGPREILLAVVHSRWAAIVANPVVAAVIFFASLVAFYWTDLFEWALTTHSGHAFMTIHFTVTGYAFVWSLIGRDPGPPKWSAPLRLLVLFATLAAHAFFGLAIMQGQWLLAPGFFLALDLDWMPDLLGDQQIGGTIAWGIGEMPTLVLALLVTRDWLRSDTREAERTDRQADRDDDAELTAYNARLQALADRDQRSAGR